MLDAIGMQCIMCIEENARIIDTKVNDKKAFSIVRNKHSYDLQTFL